MAQKRLAELVNIKAGYPFRGAVTEIIGGGVFVIQPKDISELGDLIPETAIETELTGRRDADWLKRDDVLFISKGWRTTACYIEQDYENLTCSPSLFILQAKAQWQNRLNMQFLAWQLNQAPAQNYFRRTAEGSGQLNIRKQTLADLIVGIPPLEKQHALAKLYQASVSEHKLLTQLINNRIQQNSLIAADLLRQRNEDKPQ